MESPFLRYLIPLELPDPEAAAQSRPLAPAVSSATPEAPAVSRAAFAARSTPAAGATEPQRVDPPAPRPDPAATKALELRLAQLEDLHRELAGQAASTQAAESVAAQLRRELARMERRVAELEERPEPARAGLHLPLGTALLVPLAGVGLNAAFHFGLYQLFLHSGELGSPLANVAAETLLGFQIATEAAPHVYFYWMAIELLWSSLLIVLGLGVVLRWLRRAGREEQS